MRPSATVVIPVFDEWRSTRACLDALRPTLRARDEVVVVDDGSADETAAGLRHYPWVRVVRRAVNGGTAAAWNAGAEAATGEVLVLLDNDTLVTSRWLDGLLRPMSDLSVSATGPRSNEASGPQLVPDVHYAAQRAGEVQAFARAWRQDHRGRVTETEVLGGFCLAVRREAFTAVGGADEAFGHRPGADLDLSLRLSGIGGRLLVVHETFVHHHGRRTYATHGLDLLSLQRSGRELLAVKHPDAHHVLPPTGVRLSACLIVKDEERVLADCLAAVRNWVDEIVVLDTGSTDASPEIARAAGAVVVEGAWEDDFAQARNHALAHCTGEWVVHVDADEELLGDPSELHMLLDRCPTPSLQIEIDNVDDDDQLKFTHTAVRFFQRRAGRWEGRLHEQVVSRDGSNLGRSATDVVRIRHTGYRDELVQTRDKHERNLRVARAGLAAAGATDGQALLSVARALTSTGRYDEALEVYASAKQHARDRVLLRHVLRAAAEALLDAGRPEQALPWITEFRLHTSSTAMPDYLEGTARLALGDLERATALFDGVSEAQDEDFTVATRLLLLRRGLSFAGVQRWAEASADLTAAALDHGAPVWGQLLVARWRAGLPVEDLAAIGEDRQVAVLAQALLVAPAAADLLAEALWDRQPGTPRVLAFALQFASRAGVEVALRWSVRLRQAGVADSCPLLALAGQSAARPLDRIRAAAVAAGAFSDPRSEAAVELAAAYVDVADFDEALHALDALAPELLPAFVVGGAKTRSRCSALADALARGGADEQAAALRRHAAA